MKILEFSFKREAVWMVALSLLPILFGLAMLLGSWLLK